MRMTKKRTRGKDGQATVEAAFALPVLLIAILILIQPGIVLYDRMVMRAAAAEGCRVLATAPAGQTEACKDYILRRLGAIPQQSLFHQHDTTCSWNIQLEGDESAETVSVAITNKVKPLPLVGAAAYPLGILDDQGFLTISVRQECQARPAWAAQSCQGAPSSDWVGKWSYE